MHAFMRGVNWFSCSVISAAA